MRLCYSVVTTGLLCLSLTACGDDELGSGTESDGGSASAGTDTDTGGTDTDAATGTDTDAATGTESDGGTDSGGTDTDGEPVIPYDGDPLPEADVGEWIWVDFPEARCRDGSSTGIGVRYGLENKLMIFFQGGGACFNTLSCQLNPQNYDEGNFGGWKDGGGRSGILDPENPDNPVGEWSVIYVPYCTGDVHAGDRPDANLSGVPGTQQFVGYRNVDHFLNRVVPTFWEAEHVLVTGVSAGGFGAALNYDRMTESFLKSEVTLIDDSGPPMADPYLAPCLQQQWRDAWNLDMTLPQDCADCFNADGGGIINLASFLGDKHSDEVMALISSEEDGTIRSFFGFGNNDCSALIPNMDAATFKEGLYDLRDNG
ncbi:MAG: hypothetical protein KC486_06600, partial [Myxococcales bacterium]|nr:hypothetical protein [Myxococcales bacterium]